VHVREAPEGHGGVARRVLPELAQQRGEGGFLTGADRGQDRNRCLGGSQTVIPARKAPARGNCRTKLMVLTGP
jgi:hypothetical protein